MLKIIARFLRVLNSETEPGQISLALCFAMIAGLTTLLSPHNLLLLIPVLLLRVNLSAFILGVVFFSGIAYLIDPIFHHLGLALLTAGALEGLWTALYNSTLWRIERFNNSIVMGSIFFSLVAFIPLYLIANLAIRRYREHVLAWVRKSRVMQLFMASKFYRVYNSLHGWGGEG
ncbi:MAG: TIGR03546 family protein [Deltaproteobacteria bacterium]|nr:TIGR03546 family protein [Deltaproteobacteria bacterium]